MHNGLVDDGRDDSIAVDVLLEPDERILDRAARANAELRSVWPDGFELDDDHRPHVTVLQCYLDTTRLDEALDEIAAAVDRAELERMELRADGLYYIPWQTLGLAGIVAEPTDELLDLQQGLRTAVDSFRVAEGSADAFVRPAEDPEINTATIEYIGAFDTLATGERYNPHVTIGLAPASHLDALIAEPFDEFTFGVTGAAVFQLGNFGTASRLLRRF